MTPLEKKLRIKALFKLFQGIDPSRENFDR